MLPGCRCTEFATFSASAGIPYSRDSSDCNVHSLSRVGPNPKQKGKKKPHRRKEARAGSAPTKEEKKRRAWDIQSGGNNTSKTDGHPTSRMRAKEISFITGKSHNLVAGQTEESRLGLL